MSNTLATLDLSEIKDTPIKEFISRLNHGLDFIYTADNKSSFENISVSFDEEKKALFFSGSHIKKDI